MTDDISSSQLSIIVDLLSSPFDFKSLCHKISFPPPTDCNHHYYHFAGLRSFTIPFQTDQDETTINSVISKFKTYQNQQSDFPPYWICYKECEVEPPTCEVIKKNLKLGRFYTNNSFGIEYTSGALVQLDKYIYEPSTEIKDGYRLVFYHDRIDLDYGDKENKFRKSFKAEMMDKCAVIMTGMDHLTIFLNMNGNSIDYVGKNNDDSTKNSGEQTVSYKRIASPEAQPFYSTIRLVISFLNDESNTKENGQSLSRCKNQFMEFFHRNHINQCYGIIRTMATSRDLSSLTKRFMVDKNLSFIKQYCWQMLLSIGYRFQQRLGEGFIKNLNLIEDDDEFYQTSLHIWRRSGEYFFIDLLTELHNYQEKARATALLMSSSNSYSQRGYKKEETIEQERWSIYAPPRHYAYVPSVTLTPTTICVKPLKLVKTNRVLREEQFGGNLMFALVDVKDETGTIDLFPHDYQALREKTASLLENGFDLGATGRTYRYLHHSQSQLKDKQFWFYHHDRSKNFSFEDAFEWMGDFQDENIVAKHSARIAQCFTSAEATIEIPTKKVEYIADIRSIDHRYNFTDGVGTMSTAIRDKINPHRQFSAVQIRYGGCKGVISVNPDLDNADCQLRIRNSMNKFKSKHEVLELCRISKPRPLYLNRQIIVLLSHRKIHDRTFLLLANRHQQLLSESLVYPDRAYELLAEKINRSLFPLRALIKDAQLNLIQEPFFQQLLITTGKFELAQMKERTRLKLPRNTARNMIGIVDEYGILEYGQVFIQYTELTSEYNNNSESEKTVILEQKVVVTKNPCHHPGDIRVFEAVDVPKLRHLKDVIVFPQRGQRPHPNEISGSDLDGDEYAVIWHPEFIPQTANDTPYDYDSDVPMKRIVGRPVNRADIQQTVLDISEQSCVGKLCSIHLANLDLFGVDDPKTLAIAGYISEELDAAKTGRHPLTPKQIMALQADLGNERPDYFDKPYYKSYPSEHILGQLFRSSLRFESNWSVIQTPPATTPQIPIDPLLVHDYHYEHAQSVAELARIYRESIMDIIYVYHFSSDIDLLCRFDSSSPIYRTPLSKQQTESACLIADSAQVELKQLIRRIRKLFFDELRLSTPTNHRCHPPCAQCNDRKMAKASALYIFCYNDTNHARRMLSLPWLFAPLLIETRKLNIKKQSKLLSPAYVAQMLEIQPYRLIGQSLHQAVQILFETRKSSYFHHIYSIETPMKVTLVLQPLTTAKRLQKKREISLIDYLLIEIFHHFVQPSLSKVRSPIIESKPNLFDTVWSHILTRFVLNECSPLLLLTSTTPTNPSLMSTIKDLQFWSDEQACLTLQRFLDISAKCADHGPEPTDFAHANEYLVSMLQKMATTGSLFSN